MKITPFDHTKEALREYRGIVKKEYGLPLNPGKRKTAKLSLETHCETDLLLFPIPNAKEKQKIILKAKDCITFRSL